jgi:hypothetical protein
LIKKSEVLYFTGTVLLKNRNLEQKAVRDRDKEKKRQRGAANLVLREIKDGLKEAEAQDGKENICFEV